MVGLGGSKLELKLPTWGSKRAEQLRSLAISVARLSNLTADPHVYLDLSDNDLNAIQTILNTPTNRGGIGHRLNKLKVLRIDTFKDKSINNTQRLISAHLTRDIQENANLVMSLSFGATQFRFDRIIDGEIERIAIPAQLNKIKDDEWNEIKNSDPKLYKKFTDSQNRIIKEFNDDKLNRELQNFRIISTIKKLLGDDEQKLIGFAFSSAGILDLLKGSLNQPKVDGMGTDKAPFMIADLLEKTFNRPAVALNDVDAEGANTVSMIILTAKEISENRADEESKFYPTAKTLTKLNDGESVIIFAYGGGTGIGACQYKVTRHGDEFEFKILSGPGISAGESGHDYMDFNHPTIKMAINKLSMSKKNLKSLLVYREKKTCAYCGNYLDLESLASGSAGDFFAKWVYQRLRTFNRSKDTATRNNAKEALKHFKLRQTIQKLIALYQSGNTLAAQVIEFMAKIFAAHMVTHYELGKSIMVDGKAQVWDKFIIDQGMFRNEFFKKLVLDSLKNDFGKDFTKIFLIVIDYKEDNQSLGALAVLKEAIR